MHPAGIGAPSRKDVQGGDLVACNRRRESGFLGNRRGATAVEFALIAAPLIFILMATLDLALVFLVSTSLNAATIKAAREIKTGQTQHSGQTQAAFAGQVCSNMGWLASQCPSSISVSVQSFSSFSAATMPSPVNNGVFNPSGLTFNLGNAGDIVLVKVYYQWPLVTPFFSTPLQTLSNGDALIIATAIFRNEPYS